MIREEYLHEKKQLEVTGNYLKTLTLPVKAKKLLHSFIDRNTNLFDKMGKEYLAKETLVEQITEQIISIDKDFEKMKKSLDIYIRETK